MKIQFTIPNMKYSKLSKLGYLILYRFLRENLILDKYLNNLINLSHYKRDNYANVLKEMVKNYESRYCSYNYSNLFNYLPSSFSFNESDEGFDFWLKYARKWCQYYDKKKYMLE